MKLLLDSCVWGGAAPELRSNGHDVLWSDEWDTDPGDEEIMAIAHREGRILVTLDKDFGELAIVMGLQHCGLLRIAGFAARQPVLSSTSCQHTAPNCKLGPSSPRFQAACGSVRRTRVQSPAITVEVDREHRRWWTSKRAAKWFTVPRKPVSICADRESERDEHRAEDQRTGKPRLIGVGTGY